MYYITARTKYALRALLALAAAEPTTVSSTALAATQHIPSKFLQTIMGDLRRARLIRSHRGYDGGYRLARPAGQITIGEVVRLMDGSIGEEWEESSQDAPDDSLNTRLRQVLVAADTAVRDIVDTVTLADLVDGPLPARILGLTAAPDG